MTQQEKKEFKDYQLNVFKNAYSKIGLAEDGIKERIKQVNSLAKQNPSNSLTGKGGGVCVATDRLPLFATDWEEASALSDVLAPTSRAMDVDTYNFNIPSNGVPLPLLTIWTTRMIQEIFKVPTLSQLTAPWQQGAPGVMEIKIPTVGYDGSPDIYDDFSAAGNNSINTNWVTRQIAYFEDTLGWGEMQQAQYGMAKIDYVSQQREGMAIIVSQFQNDLGFQGYTGIPNTDQPMLWGILNEPNLNPAIMLPNDGQVPGTLIPTTAWSGKDYSQILRDVQLLVEQVLFQALGNATTSSRFILAIPPSADAALMTSTTFGKTVKEQLIKMFPKIEFVVVPNFEASFVTTGQQTDQTVVMVLFANNKTGEMPYSELFVTKWQSHRPFYMPTSVTEKMSFGLGGVILKWPMFVSFAYGV